MNLNILKMNMNWIWTDIVDYRATSLGPEWQRNVSDERGGSSGNFQLCSSNRMVKPNAIDFFRLLNNNQVVLQTKARLDLEMRERWTMDKKIKEDQARWSLMTEGHLADILINPPDLLLKKRRWQLQRPRGSHPPPPPCPHLRLPLQEAHLPHSQEGVPPPRPPGQLHPPHTRVALEVDKLRWE